MGTIAGLFAAMQQALATASGLHQSLQRDGALVIEAWLDEQGTTYRFSPIHASSLSLGV
jgi:hypothetical protein